MSSEENPSRKFAMKYVVVAIIAVIVISAVVGVYYQPPAKENIIIATTTSLYDTKILDAIKTEFEVQHSQYNVSFISAGTGIAIQYAKNGDADLILVHDPPAEKKFLEEGYGVDRKILAYNFFVIVGPPNDPAGINGTSPTEALRKIVEYGSAGNALWVSRGDNSGTNAKEKRLWTATGFNVTKIRNESWYLEAGSGMGATLRLANERNAYTLADTATYLDYYSKGLVNLKIIVSGGYELLNVYSIIAVNPEKISERNFSGAVKFIEFMMSDDGGQKLFAEFGKERFGQPLFFPAVTTLKENGASQTATWIMSYAYINGTECPSEYRRHPELYK